MLLAGALTTVVFALTPGFSSVIRADLDSLLGLPVQAPSLSPPRQDPVSYLVLLVVFGGVLVVVRVVTGSLWACVGFHLAFLTVNRLLLLRRLRRRRRAATRRRDQEPLVG